MKEDASFSFMGILVTSYPVTRHVTSAITFITNIIPLFVDFITALEVYLSLSMTLYSSLSFAVPALESKYS